jgi:HD-GYP domain-containing protein (c-di-GMP phosphodiesterase class II)
MSEEQNGNYPRFTDNNQINILLTKLVYDVQQFTESQLSQIKRLTEIGAALSGEKNIDRLLEMIVEEAQKFTSADGGTLYIMSDDETELQFAIARTTSLKVRMGGTGGQITWPPVKLIDNKGIPNHANVSAYVALSGETVNIANVYDAQGFNFEGTKKFDQSTGYHSQSMLVVPMRNHENDIIGVLQLLNAQNPVTGEVINFSRESQEMTLSLASQAAVALSNNRLIHDLQNLLESFIKTIATAIDEKSPYTGGHVRRVAELTMTIAQKINQATEGHFALISLSDDQLRELRLAAWLHDVGKITTPEHVVDKATKLETIHDRIN